MKGIIDHYIVTTYNLEDEIKQDIINRNLNIDENSSKEIDNLINQLFEEI